MAIDQGTTTVTTTKSDRCWRFEMFIDSDLDQQMRMHREIMAKDQTGKILARDQTSIPPTERLTSQIKTKTYTAAGVTVTGQQFLALANKIADVERQWDIDNPPTQIVFPPP